LYGAGNLAGNYRKGVAATLKLTLNAGEGSSRQPELTPEMRELIARLTQEQLAAQMQTQEELIQNVLRRQREFLDSQLDAFRQEQGWNLDGQDVGQQGGSQQSQHNVRAPACDDDADDPYEVYGEGDDDDDDDGIEEDD
jgi:alanine-alpha-ketoisovalerate/valine-pyruvate aminotransferase